jgi:hypothetical protein
LLIKMETTAAAAGACHADIEEFQMGTGKAVQFLKALLNVPQTLEKLKNEIDNLEKFLEEVVPKLARIEYRLSRNSECLE